MRLPGFGVLFAALLPMAGLSQQTRPPGTMDRRLVHLNVAVSAKSGAQAAGLVRQDFTVLDNGKAVPIVAFRAVSAKDEPVEVIVVIDAINLAHDAATYARDQVDKFLHGDGGKLDHPTTFGILTDAGLQVQNKFTKDGNELSSEVEGQVLALRGVKDRAGIWGAAERLHSSLTAVHQLAAFAAPLPGRKVVVWISPGWPLISDVEVQLDDKQQQHIFSDVVSFSNELRKANITMFDINPLGVEEDLISANHYRDFVKGVAKPSQTQIGDLGLQVLAVQSGGQTLESRTDIAGMLGNCLAQTDFWYEIDFAMPASGKPDEYHHIDVRVDKARTVARTRDGYYTQP